jgi:phosphotransferase system IIB component
MASVEELRKKVADLNEKLAGMESFKVSTATGKSPVMVKGRGARTMATDRFVNTSTTNVEKNPEYDKTLSELLSAQTELQDAIYGREGTYNTLAEQIRALGGAGGMGSQVGQPQAINQAVAALGGDQNFGASDLATRLNFQVSDEQILNDYNQAKLGRLNQLVQQGNAQVAGITERLNAAQNLLGSLPAGDPRRASSEVVVNQLRSDLASV